MSEDYNKAFNSGITDINASPNSLSISIKNNTIDVSDATSSAMVVVEQVGSEYIMKTSDGKVIKANGKAVEIDETGTTRSTFKLEGGNIIITSGTTFTLQYNNSADLFRYYGTTQKPICLYKLA